MGHPITGSSQQGTSPRIKSLRETQHGSYPGCSATRELEAHHIVAVEHWGETVLENLILLCPRHHTLLHDHHIQTSGTGNDPTITDALGRAITTYQPYAPPV